MLINCDLRFIVTDSLLNSYINYRLTVTTTITIFIFLEFFFNPGAPSSGDIDILLSHPDFISSGKKMV